MFIDAHTHSFKTADYSFVMDKHAIGIHPWELTSDLSMAIIKAKFQSLYFGNVFAIGECGLDRVGRNLKTIEDQIIIFIWHLEVAILQKKPLIVHCVRAYSDLLQIFKQCSTLPPLLIHDFSGNDQQAFELSKYPVTFSLGKNRLMKAQQPLVLTVDKILLETDDQFEVSIQDLYLRASDIFNIDQSELQKQLLQNFLNLFCQTHDVSAPNFINNFCR